MELLIAIPLTIIVCVLIVERYLFQKETTKRYDDAIRAVLSKSVYEYKNTESVKQKKQEEIVPDLVDMADISEEEFNEFVKQLN
jgi:hypothetical protein